VWLRSTKVGPKAGIWALIDSWLLGYITILITGPLIRSFSQSIATVSSD
jgi:hypothetical protein